jgi:sugar lactone lactonase YvrE
MTGLGFGESPRWHDGRLWVADWAAREIVAIDGGGAKEVMVTLGFSSFAAICFDWLPDGSLLIVSARESRLLRQEPDGSLVTYAELGSLALAAANEIVVDGRGNVYLNGAGFDLTAGEAYRPGAIALVTPDGSVRQVADDFAFPNGMAVAADNATLLVAESYGNKLTALDIEDDGSLANRRVWADLGDGVPDGICIDSEGAVWYGDVPNKRCARVREGGETLEAIELDRGCFACMLGGADRKTLFMVAREWRGLSTMAETEPVGAVLTATAHAPGVGWPWG